MNSLRLFSLVGKVGLDDDTVLVPEPSEPVLVLSERGETGLGILCSSFLSPRGNKKHFILSKRLKHPRGFSTETNKTEYVDTELNYFTILQNTEHPFKVCKEP